MLPVTGWRRLLLADWLLRERALEAMFATSQVVFDALEGGEGWDAVKEHCAADATFSCQAVDASSELPPVAALRTLAEYATWMQDVAKLEPDAAFWEVKAASFDEARSSAMYFAVFGGYTDYVYIFSFDAPTGKIKGLTKVSQRRPWPPPACFRSPAPAALHRCPTLSVALKLIYLLVL